MAIKVLNKFNIIVIESNAFTVEKSVLEEIKHPNIIEYYGSMSTRYFDLLELECATDSSVFCILDILYSYIIMFMIEALYLRF